MNAITRTDQVPALRPVLIPQTFDQLVRFAEMAATSGLMPRDYANKPGAIMIAVQMGSELGLQPMQSLTSIAVINNRPALWGDGLIGICRQSPLCEDIQESIAGEGEARTATCVAKRRGASPCTSRFSVTDAKRAGLWGKTGPWTQYPDRMLQNRARGFALRDAFPDLLRGLKTVEELRDTPPDTYQGATLDHRPEPAAPDAAPPAPAQKARTWATLLADIHAELAGATDIDEVNAIADSPNVRMVQTSDREAAIREVKAMLAAAEARFADTPHDPETGEVAEAEFPGDR